MYPEGLQEITVIALKAYPREGNSPRSGSLPRTSPPQLAFIPLAAGEIVSLFSH